MKRNKKITPNNKIATKSSFFQEKNNTESLLNVRSLIQENVANQEPFSNLLKKVLKTFYPDDWQKILKECGIGVLVGVGLALKTAIIMGLLEKFYDEQYDLPNPYGVNLTTLYACIIGPAFEEFAFRGLLPMAAKFNLEKYFGTYFSEKLSILGVNSFFALGHPSSKISSFISGLFYQKLQINNKGSLWANTVAHITHNTLATTSYLDPVIPFVKKLF